MKTCAVEGCGRAHVARGLCTLHYRRLVKNGDPSIKSSRPARSPSDVLASQLRKQTMDIWRGMHARCRNPSSPTYFSYGARGIRVCERWSSFDAFVSDMGLRPEGMTLDRISGGGPYEPGNCRWATPVEQARNRKNTTFIHYDGRTQSVIEWAREMGVSNVLIFYRLHAGLPLNLVLSKKKVPRSLRQKTYADSAVLESLT